eukprot:TRINITY_DN1463_c0_g1_i11.p1 TRINITY_DN1463_c0_g1~~TRINITY_DN1463_c0_g1_i11.p1  ORF type:complete len:843 (+),score=187.79 TRINITY_DN1463_c0_g1_i11:383-2911(+)
MKRTHSGTSRCSEVGSTGGQPAAPSAGGVAVEREGAVAPRRQQPLCDLTAAFTDDAAPSMSHFIGIVKALNGAGGGNPAFGTHHTMSNMMIEVFLLGMGLRLDNGLFRGMDRPLSCQDTVLERRQLLQHMYMANFQAFVKSIPQLPGDKLLLELFPRACDHHLLKCDSCGAVDESDWMGGSDRTFNLWKFQKTTVEFLRATEFSADLHHYIAALEGGTMPVGCTQAIAAGAGHPVTRLECRKAYNLIYVNQRIRRKKQRREEDDDSYDEPLSMYSFDLQENDGQMQAEEQDARLYAKAIARRLGITGRPSEGERHRIETILQAEWKHPESEFERVWGPHGMARAGRFLRDMRSVRLGMAELRETAAEREAAHPLLGVKTSSVCVAAWCPFFGVDSTCKDDFSSAATALSPWQLTLLFEQYATERDEAARRRLLVALVYLRHKPETAGSYALHLPGLVASMDTITSDRDAGVQHLAHDLDEVGRPVQGQEWFTKPWAADNVNHFPFFPCATLAVASTLVKSDRFSVNKKVLVATTACGMIAFIHGSTFTRTQSDNRLWNQARKWIRDDDVVLTEGSLRGAASCIAPNVQSRRQGYEKCILRDHVYTRRVTLELQEFNRAHAAAHSRATRCVARLQSGWAVMREEWVPTCRGPIGLTDPFLDVCLEAVAQVHNFRFKWSLPELPIAGFSRLNSTLLPRCACKLPEEPADGKTNTVSAALFQWTKHKKKKKWTALAPEDSSEWGTFGPPGTYTTPDQGVAVEGLWADDFNPDRECLDGAEEMFDTALLAQPHIKAKDGEWGEAYDSDESSTASRCPSAEASEAACSDSSTDSSSSVSSSVPSSKD